MHVVDHMSMLWEMEQRQKQENYQLLKQQVREAFHMQRHQIQVRHQMVSLHHLHTQQHTHSHIHILYS